MIYPEFLKKEDYIGITAPSDGRSSEVDIRRLENAEANLKSMGYNVIETAHVRCSENGRSADAVTRGAEFNTLVADDKCRLILCASGGDYLFEMLPFLDYELMKNNPTWVEGMSDPTGITFTVTTNCDVATIYQANAGEFGMEKLHHTLTDNIKILEGEHVVMNSCDRFQSGWQNYVTGLESYAVDSEVNWRIITGEESVSLRGRLIGGCLDVITNICGTGFDNTKSFVDKYKNDGILWYFEVFSMTPENIAFTLWKLKEAGWFENAAGFIFGRECMVNTEYSQINHDDGVLCALGDLGVPIVTGADIGHRPPHITMVNGAIGNVEVKGGSATVSLEMI